MGFRWGEYEEHDGSLKIDFWTSFDKGVFWSETLNVDLEHLGRFLTKWRLDLDSGGYLESNGMIKIVG